MIVLGLNAFHADSAAALIRDGTLVAAAEEERFRRVKHWAGFPSRAVAYCLEEADVDLTRVDHIAINQDGSANLLRKAAYLCSKRPDFSLLLSRMRNRKPRAGITDFLTEAFPLSRFGGQMHNVEHHFAHLSSAFHVSPFRDAAVLSVDGFGDFASSAWGEGHDRTILVDERVYFPHSLGTFYQALTQYLGFPHYGDEYKVMGLAPYGCPTHLEAMRQIVRLKDHGKYELDLTYFRHHHEKIDYQWEDGSPQFAILFSPALDALLGPRRHPSEPLENRHRDIARSVQQMYEEAFFHLLRHIHERSGLPNLALAGGCAMNSVANGKVRRMTPFQHLYVQSAAGDAGGAIGAAFATWHKLGGQRSFVMNHASWGPQFGRDEIWKVIHEHRLQLDHAACTVENIADEAELCQRTAKFIADGKVVGWFQGRMEWGPRALGNRSILCDPRRPDMKEILNATIKRRESFRPFAPSILKERVSEWFEEDEDVPFMMQVFQVREPKRALVPAVTHVDGSGRLQTVQRETNGRYHQLITAFDELTNVPMVLNTSFNENEPVVCSPVEALDCFLRTKMDVLVVDSVVIARQPLSS